jgi:hypothetical protein
MVISVAQSIIALASHVESRVFESRLTTYLRRQALGIWK